MDQSNLLKNLVEFNNKSRPRTKEGKDKKRDTYVSTYVLYERQELIYNTFNSGIFPIKSKKCELVEILTLKQILQGLPIAIAQVKAGNTSDLMKLDKSYIPCIEQKKSLKRYITIQRI